MKLPVLLISLIFLLTSGAQAQKINKKITELPGFHATNTGEIELKKIILTDEQTQVDAVIYGAPGTPAVISSATYLEAEGKSFRLREAENISIDGITEPELIPESGRLNVILSFAPLPPGVHEVDFIEKEFGWKIYGVQLSRSEPYVYVPAFLKESTAGNPELPEPGLSAGKAIVNGYILGYDPRMELSIGLSHYDPLFKRSLTGNTHLRPDGSFHIEADMLRPDTASLTVNRTRLPIFLVPNEETTVYIHLPRLSMADSHLLKRKYAHRQKAWFDGTARTINTELATQGKSPALDVYRSIEKNIMGSEAVQKQLQQDIGRVQELCKRMADSPSLTSDDEKLLKSLHFAEIADYLRLKSKTMQAEAVGKEASHGAVIARIDSTVSGTDIIARITDSYRGRPLLIDFWATWCGPCRKSMQAMRPLKQSLAAEDIVYIYLTGSTSPEDIWKKALREIGGIHYRLTAEQWKSLCKEHAITGIPAYLIISREGKPIARHTGFPGADTLRNELLRAGRE